MTDAMTDLERDLAKAIATAVGDDLDAIPADKSDWIDRRGAGRDVNMPFACDYASAARVVVSVIRAHFAKPETIEAAAGGVHTGLKWIRPYGEMSDDGREALKEVARAALRAALGDTP